MTNVEKLSQGKNATGWISGHHSQESIINNQAVTNMRNLTTTLAYPKIPIYSWTFAPIPNRTWSYNRLLLMHESQYVTNFSNLIDCCWLQNFPLQDNEDQEVLGYKTLRRINAVTSHRVYEFWVLISVLDDF